MIPIEKIRPSQFQARRAIDPSGVEELAASIRECGLLNPVLVRPSGDGYELVHGERRLMACRLVGLTSIPAEVRELTDEQAFLAGLVENIQREQLSPVDEAVALQRLLDDFGYSQARAGEVIGRSQQYVADRLSLLKLSEPVQDMITARAVSPSVGRMLSSVEPERAEELALEVAQGRLTVRGLRQRIDGGDGPDFQQAVIGDRPPEDDLFGRLEWLNRRRELFESPPAKWSLYERTFALNVLSLDAQRAAGQCLTVIGQKLCKVKKVPDQALIGRRRFVPFVDGLAAAAAGMEITYEDDGRPLGIPDWHAFETKAPIAWKFLQWEDPKNRPTVEDLADAMFAAMVLFYLFADGLLPCKSKEPLEAAP